VDYPAEGEPTYQTYDKDLASIQAQVKSANKILLLIHGIIGNTTDIVAFARTLKQAGKYDLVLTFDYENLNTEINDISYQLKRRLVGESAPYTDKEQFEGIGISKDKKIDIIAHSMGGLVSRHMIEQRGGSEFVNRLIMCGTPNGGSNFGKIEQFRKIASIGALIGANLFAPFSAVAWLVSALKGVKMATGSSSLLFKTLGQMDRNSTFLHGLNQDGKAGGIPYFILAGNVQNYEPENTGLWQKILDKTLEGVGNAVNLGEPNDIAVLTNDIKQTGKNTDVTIYDIPCHHLNYFVEENSVQKLLEILQ
jgi:pimeloyl-ACP methyl ester carboxylesterase